MLRSQKRCVKESKVENQASRLQVVVNRVFEWHQSNVQAEGGKKDGVDTDNLGKA